MNLGTTKRLRRGEIGAALRVRHRKQPLARRAERFCTAVTVCTPNHYPGTSISYNLRPSTSIPWRECKAVRSALQRTLPSPRRLLNGSTSSVSMKLVAFSSLGKGTLHITMSYPSNFISVIFMCGNAFFRANSYAGLK